LGITLRCNTQRPSFDLDAGVLERSADVTASARNCLPSISDAALATVVNITWIWPPIRSVMAGAEPL
jgi:hypothetical protein